VSVSLSALTRTDPVVGQSTVQHGISELVTNDPTAGPGLLGLLPDAAVVIKDGLIEWIGSAASAPPADVAVDLGGRAVLPGWVDSHSHVVFAGDRAAEFSARMAGTPYRAGGMQATVAATREATEPELLTMARRNRREMIAGGTTYMETKTGYGLTTHDELRAARTAKAAGFDEITFLGAHVVPPEFAQDPDAYLDLVTGVESVDRGHDLIRLIGGRALVDRDGMAVDVYDDGSVVARRYLSDLPGDVCVDHVDTSDRRT